MRVVDALCLMVAIGGAAYVYNVKHEAEVAHDDRRTLEREISAMSQDVGLLAADLAALEQPARLQGVISSLPEAFALEPISSGDYVRLDDIPFRTEIAALQAQDLAEADSVDAVEIEAVAVPIVEPAPTPPNPLDLLLQGIVDAAPNVQVEALPGQLVDGIGALLQDVMPEERP